MKKIILCLFMALLLCPITVQAEDDQGEDQNTKDTDDINEIVSDVPINKEVSGSIFGSIYGKNDDIVIDVPGKGSGNQGGSQSGGRQSGGSRSNGGITEEADPDYYEMSENGKILTIFKALFMKAKLTEKNIVMRILDDADQNLEYRVRIYYKDIKDKDIDDVEITFGDECDHKGIIEELLIGAEARAILSCKQKEIDFPVLIGVAVPKKWDHGYGIYHYAYQPEQKDLELLRNDLQIDEENIVEIPLEAGKDNVFYNHVLPVEDKNLLTWVKGLSSGSPRIDGGTAVKAISAFTMGVLLIAGNTVFFIRYKKRKVHSPEQTSKYSYDK